MIKYDNMNHKFQIGQEYDHQTGGLRDTFFIMRRWGNVLVEAAPRYGKSVLVKDLVVKISKKRKIIIFDYGKEWEDNLSKYNMWAPYPDRLVGYKVLDNFTFNIMSFNNDDDYASLGFTGFHASFICSVIRQSVDFHRGDLTLISEMLSRLPVKGGQHYSFNNNYGTNLDGPVNFSSKTKIVNWWAIIKRYFWQGKDDPRPIYDFAKELLENDHLIIDFGIDDPVAGQWIARAYAAKALEQLKTVWADTHPVFVFEESRMFFPKWEGDVSLSSNNEAYNLVTHGPKNGVMVIFIVQHKNQIYIPIMENIHIRLIGVVQNAKLVFPYDIRLKYDPERKIREFLYLDINCTPNDRHYSVFRPCIPCMSFASER